MDWKQLLAYVTGSVDQERPRRNAYLVTENRLLRQQIRGRVRHGSPIRCRERLGGLLTYCYREAA